jgi:hypothetical protein
MTGATVNRVNAGQDDAAPPRGTAIVRPLRHVRAFINPRLTIAGGADKVPGTAGGGTFWIMARAAGDGCLRRRALEPVSADCRRQDGTSPRENPSPAQAVSAAKGEQPLALPAIGLAWRRATCQSVPARRVLLRTVRCPAGLTGFILDCESAFVYGEPPAGACE